MNDQSPEQPLPCPFCGSAIKQMTDFPNFGVCPTCQITLSMDRWNTRARPDDTARLDWLESQATTPGDCLAWRLPIVVGENVRDGIDHARAALQPEPTPAVLVDEGTPATWRMLEVGEVIQEGDEFRWSEDCSWSPCKSGIGEQVRKRHAGNIRRRVAPAETPTPTPSAEAVASKALQCLYIAVDESIARDVQTKVAAAFDALKRELSSAQAKHAEEMTEKQREVDQARTTRRAFQELAKKKHEKDATEISSLRADLAKHAEELARLTTAVNTETEHSMALSEALAEKTAEASKADQYFDEAKALRYKLSTAQRERDAALRRVGELEKSILECEQDRLNAQNSGLPTGWEHPGTQTMFKKAVALAARTP